MIDRELMFVKEAGELAFRSAQLREFISLAMKVYPNLETLSTPFVLAGLRSGIRLENLSLTMAQVVHLMWEGKTLCDMPGLPCDWPEKHVWVGREDADKVTCVTCQEKWKIRMDYEAKNPTASKSRLIA